MSAWHSVYGAKRAAPSPILGKTSSLDRFLLSFHIKCSARDRTYAVADPPPGPTHHDRFRRPSNHPVTVDTRLAMGHELAEADQFEDLELPLDRAQVCACRLTVMINGKLYACR